ncbi:MAG: deoxyribose-phosphate aldolase [Bacteroidales bacterium]
MIDFHKNININESQVEEEVKNILQKGLGNYSEKDALRIILNCIDLTTLEGADTKDKVTAMCEKGLSYNQNGENIPNVAAICVYPTFAHQVAEKLKNSGIKTACVAGAFPSGQSPLFVKLSEVKYAVDEGAEEIDMVISRGTFLEGNYQTIYDEIAAIKKCCGNAHLKVILETGELKTQTNICIASDISIAAGADFIKTSTGKILPAATEEAFYTMLLSIKSHYLATGKMIGIKPAGGISEPHQALNYFMILNHILGEKWLNNKFFRIGASRLADKIAEKIS